MSPWPWQSSIYRQIGFIRVLYHPFVDGKHTFMYVQTDMELMIDFNFSEVVISWRGEKERIYLQSLFLIGHIEVVKNHFFEYPEKNIHMKNHAVDSTRLRGFSK
jgi:hypothetical protein